jgi:hypothetical protein
MAAPKRTKIQIEKDRVKIARWYLQGRPQSEIAEELGVSRPQISYDLRAIRKAWLESSIVDFNEARSRELAKLDLLESTHWDAWLRSISPKKTETAKNVVGPKEKPIRDEFFAKEEQQVGDKRFLDGVAWCIERRCKLFGLDAPNQVRVGWTNTLPDGSDPDEVKRQFAAMLALAQAASDSEK